jgi:chloramphenicol O-acetyltransferase
MIFEHPNFLSVENLVYQHKVKNYFVTQKKNIKENKGNFEEFLLWVDKKSVVWNVIRNLLENH